MWLPSDKRLQPSAAGKVLALLSAIFFAVVGIVLIVGSLYRRWMWFEGALGVFMLGQAFRRFAFSLHLTDARQRLRVSTSRGYQLWCATHVVAGGLVIVGALISLERVFGLIVAFGAFCWVWAWTWVIAHSGRWREPHDIPSAP